MNVRSGPHLKRGYKVTYILRLVCLALLCGSLWACQKAGKQSPPPQRYDLRGKVVSVDKAQRQVTIAHEEIKDYMPAMTMPFQLKDEWAFDVLSPGDEIGAALVVDGASHHLEEIAISKKSVDQPATAGNAPTNEPKPGDQVPNFSFLNQDSKPIKLQQYKGKALLLTFIYTRCPLPDYCDLMSNNFAQVDRELQKTPDLLARTHLLSITIDPAYDTPKVMRSYGAAHTGNYADEKFTHWEFATGQPEEVQRAAKYFGLIYYPEADQIVHGLRTAVITPDGKIFAVYRGNEWKPADALRDLNNSLGKS